MPITEPNSLFSNMIMTIWSKFGTVPFWAAVGEEPGSKVSVGNGVDVGASVLVAKGRGVALGVGGKEVGVTVGVLAQANIRACNSRSNVKSLDFIFVFIIDSSCRKLYSRHSSQLINSQ